MLQALCADARNSVYIISGRRKAELAAWFAPVVRVPRTPLCNDMRRPHALTQPSLRSRAHRHEETQAGIELWSSLLALNESLCCFAQEGLGLAAEHGFFFRRAGSLEWDQRSSTEDMAWQAIVGPILQQYTESTDGSNVEAKESAFVWHYGAADPDFGSLQARLSWPP